MIVADAQTETPASELRAAAERLRDTGHYGGIAGDCSNPELLSLVAALLRARDPLASWLEDHARDHSSYDCDWADDRCPGLATARALNRSKP